MQAFKGTILSCSSSYALPEPPVSAVGREGSRSPSAHTCLLLAAPRLWVFLTVFPAGRLLTWLVSKYLFPSRPLPLTACGSPPLSSPLPARVLQASELGMTSAFYKYILTTMVRTPSSTPALVPPMAFPPVGPSPGPHPSSLPQDFPILHLDGIVEDSSNILGFSMFNTSHPFYHEFVRSLNMSWRENCEASTYPGPAVSVRLGPTGGCSAHRSSRALQSSASPCPEPLPLPVTFRARATQPHSEISATLASSPPPRPPRPHWSPGASAAQHKHTAGPLSSSPTALHTCPQGTVDLLPYHQVIAQKSFQF